jgi:hypothetical protein
MGLQYRPLGMVTEALEQIGIEVTYAYEDLIFIEHNHFLLQFGKTGEILFFYANVETPEEAARRFFREAQTAVSAKGISLLERGQYRLERGAGEELSLQFIDLPSTSRRDDGT